MGQDESKLLDNSVRPKVLSERSLSAVANYIQRKKAPKIVVLTGAGISTAAGIPDFRSPKTGLYNNLARLNLPEAEAVFDITYFRQHPEPFYVLANELYPGKFHPTVSHAFIALLARKGLLDMLFTQNIDCLERLAGVPDDRVVEAHGSFATQRCIECKTAFPDDEMKAHVLRGNVPHCPEKGCDGLVKPDIVFFGEPLPKAFGQKSGQMQLADLVLVIGTSLSVYPFASLPDMAKPKAPRVLFNMERVGSFGSRPDDVMELGASDAGIRKLADALGWREELEQLWKGVVGDKEAKRQNQSQPKHEAELEDEVHKLADDVGAALKINDAGENQTEEPKVATDQEPLDVTSQETPQVEQAERADQPTRKDTSSAPTLTEPQLGSIMSKEPEPVDDKNEDTQLETPPTSENSEAAASGSKDGKL